MRQLCLAILLAAMPLAASAAGFANQSLFLSQEKVQRGETVLIYALVANEADAPFHGSVKFFDAEAPIGSVSLSLDAGEAHLASISWSPEQAGAHSVRAQLESSDGTVIESEAASFSIAEPPAADAVKTPRNTGVESSAQLQKKIESISPSTASFLKPAFETVDAARATAIGAIENQIAQTEPKLPAHGVFGKPSSSTPEETGTFSVWGILWTLYYYALTILAFLVRTALVFYPLLVVLFIWGLWKLYKKMTRRDV